MFRDGGSSRYRAEQYPWLLTADPPICRGGPALAVLTRCERLRRGDPCLCRFAAADIADELERSGAPELAKYLATRLEPEDVDELVRRLHAHLARETGDGDLAESLARLERDLNRIVEAGSGLTDEFSDDLDAVRSFGRFVSQASGSSTAHINHHTTNDNVEEKGGGGLMLILDVQP